MLILLAVEFDVEKITEVDWNDDAFANLVLPSDRKDLLQSLIEAHHRELGFDDFIKGKGQGLVINLFGPPGVGLSSFTSPFSVSTDRRQKAKHSPPKQRVNMSSAPSTSSVQEISGQTRIRSTRLLSAFSKLPRPGKRLSLSTKLTFSSSKGRCMTFFAMLWSLSCTSTSRLLCIGETNGSQFAPC